MATQDCLTQKIWPASVLFPLYFLLFIKPTDSILFAVYWSDNSRDIINFFLHFLPSDTVNKHLPIHLPRVSKWETERRISSGFGHRNVVALGHSIGGTAMYVIFLLVDSFCAFDQLSTKVL